MLVQMLPIGPLPPTYVVSIGAKEQLLVVTDVLVVPVRLQPTVVMQLVV